MSVAPAAVPDTAGLQAALALGARRAGELRRQVLVSASFHTTVSALDLFTRGTGLGRVYWGRPSERFSAAGVGAAWSIELRPGDSAQAVTDGWRQLLRDAVILPTPSRAAAGPLLLGGLAFDAHAPSSGEWADFPPGAFTLPELTVVERTGSASLTLNAVVRADDDVPAIADRLSGRLHELLSAPSSRPGRRGALEALGDADWTRKVQLVVDALRSGRAEKVVLARSVDVRSSQPVHAVLGALRERYPECAVFALERGSSCLLGATPERLVALEEGTVRTAALAGSAPRGAAAEQDEQYGGALLASSKDRREHDVVLRMIAGTLRRQCGSVFHPETPRLMKLDTVQHLYTPVTARAREGQSVLELAAALHPTPAVCGYPREAARQLIHETEQMDRGWYAGAVGWMSASGGGEFAVAIRSALYRDGSLRLYAGCGIMPDSDPSQEYAESEAKLDALRGVLRGPVE